MGQDSKDRPRRDGDGSDEGGEKDDDGSHAEKGQQYLSASGPFPRLENPPLGFLWA